MCVCVCFFAYLGRGILHRGRRYSFLSLRFRVRYDVFLEVLKSEAFDTLICSSTVPCV